MQQPRSTLHMAGGSGADRAAGLTARLKPEGVIKTGHTIYETGRQFQTLCQSGQQRPIQVSETLLGRMHDFDQRILLILPVRQ